MLLGENGQAIVLKDAMTKSEELLQTRDPLPCCPQHEPLEGTEEAPGGTCDVWALECWR